MTDYTASWEEWEALLRRRDRNPVDAAKEFLRAQGWIVERPETLSMPVKVARSGSFTEQDGYRVTLHVRADIGGRLAQVDYAINRQYADMPTRAFTGAIGGKFTKLIEGELMPQIEAGCERELRKAMEAKDE